MSNPSSRKRIVITGLGAVTPLGIGKKVYWDALVSGTSGIGPITRFDPTGFDVRIAAEVKGFEPGDFMDSREARRMDRFAQFGVAAARLAIEDATLTIDEHNAERVGVMVGSGVGGLQSLEDQMRILIEKGPSRVSPFLIPMMIADMATGQISILTGAKGPGSTVVTACATGANAIGDSMEILRRGDADVMIAGGTEAAVTMTSVAGFGNMKAMTSKFNECPQKASRPFEASRSGFVIGEGAGVLILETLENAEKRRAPHIYAELVGYGMSSDAYHITQPAPDGTGVVRAIHHALRDAGVAPEEVGYINAHGTSTPMNDKAETGALKAAFGKHAHVLAVSSTKSMTGHLLGAAGAIEAIAAVLAISEETLPPTINYDTPDPDCDLDYVPNTARKARVEVVVSNNSGFGGHNAVIVMRRFH
ncbi:MAG: beta-ketoacyl-ACP synthase II [Cytophagales bacterium]|nr:beta-ketoacyl-ACP synthase II [Armatimonadota bacterium]